MVRANLDMLGVDPPHRVPVEAFQGMAGGLAGPEVAAMAKHGEQIPLGGVGPRGVRSGRRTEMAGARRCMREPRTSGP